LDTTTIIAIYGAALSTILGAIELYRFHVEQQEKKPRVKVTLTTGLISQGNQVSPAILTLTAANVGRIPVTLTSIPSLYVSRDRKVILTEAERDVEFPHELLPGKSCNYWRDIKQLARELKRHGYSGRLKIIGEFGDALDNKYKSKPFSFDIEDWTKLGSEAVG